MKLAFVFRTSPHTVSVAREGLDALLSATAFLDNDAIGVFFIDDGIFNLLPHQQPHCILQKDFISAFSLLDLCEITQCFVCQESESYAFLAKTTPVISVTPLPYSQWLAKLKQAEKVLTF